jgi:hypothetical protein
LLRSLWPAAIGIFGFLHCQGKQRAMLALLCLSTLGYLVGLLPGFVAGHRLLPFIVLLLHIGLAEIIIRLWSSTKGSKLIVMATLALLLFAQTALTVVILKVREAHLSRDGSLLAAANILLAAFPDNVIIAGDWTGSFALAAAGRQVLSTPLAEPMIPDLELRQQATTRLLDPRVPQRERAMIARKWNVGAIVVETRRTNEATLRMLSSESTKIVKAGSLARFSLRPA